MNFRVGQKVVCVDDSQRNEQPPRVKKGNIYSISEITCEGRGVWVAELPRRAGYMGFYSDRFRPLVTRKTSIEIFEKLLKPAPQKVSV